MYTVVNSWVYEEDGVDTGLPTWHKAVIGADVAVGVIVLGLCVLVYWKYRKDSAAGIKIETKSNPPMRASRD